MHPRSSSLISRPFPTCRGLRRLHDLDPALSDAEVAELAFQQRRARAGTISCRTICSGCVISCALRAGKDFRVWSLAEPEQGEAEIIQRFFDGVEKFTPQIVSWNGGGFDLPVLHYRGLIHGVVAPRYWDLGDGDYATAATSSGTTTSAAITRAILI
jgi:predicted PolB exonuclease-like 3'-5' exonuclease